MPAGRRAHFLTGEVPQIKQVTSAAGFFYKWDEKTAQYAHMSGVLVLLHSGSWPIAVLVFIASIVVPMLKIVTLGILWWTAWRRSPRHRLQRSELYRMVEFIGRWSMLDVYAIAMLATLVQVQSFASIIVGWGALAFAAVVVLTLIASRTFDERLVWDPE